VSVCVCVCVCVCVRLWGGWLGPVCVCVSSGGIDISWTRG